MNVKELMISDLVRIKNNVESDAYFMHEDMYPGQCVKVEEVLSNGINPDWCGGEINDYLPDDAIEPIPLTDEVLEANGWERTGGASHRIYGDYNAVIFHRNENRKEIIIDKNGDRHHMLKLDLLYVHQLQHCLKICGIDKEIIMKQ